jgi:ATP-binding cassette subfamily B protein
VTHDVGETRSFARVLVLEGGRIVEDGPPDDLARRPSRYRRMLEAEHEVREGLWRGAAWRRLVLLEGRLVEGREAGEEAP